MKKYTYEDIKRFAEHKENKVDKFVEMLDGSKQRVSEDMIHSLWNKWIIDENAIRQDDENYTIFGFENRQDEK